MWLTSTLLHSRPSTLLHSRPSTLARPSVRPLACAGAAADEPFAGLVICTNTNICGKQNPAFEPGYGFASRAIECLRVLGPPGFVVNAGPCFIRCSSGVNAKMVLPTGSEEREYNGRVLRQGRPFYQLNSVGECASWLEETLAFKPPPEKLRAYDAYAEAIVILEIRGDDSSSFRATQALSLLNVAASYILDTEPTAGYPPPNAAQRCSWAGSIWRESFYETTLSLADEALEEEATTATAASGGAEAFAGGTAAQADQALKAAQEALSSKPSTQMPSSINPSGMLWGTYGGANRGTVRGRQATSSAALQGRWEEAATGAAGGMTLTMSTDGLRFEGVARSDGGDGTTQFEWSGVRLAPPLLASRGTADERWSAAVLALRASQLLQLGRVAQALDDALVAARRCPWLPEAWDALANAALAAGAQAVAAMALDEVLYLQPATAADQRGRQRWEARSAKSMATPNIRRLQAMTLAKLRSGSYVSGGAARPPVPLSPEQQRLLGQIFAPLIFDERGRAVSSTEGALPLRGRATSPRSTEGERQVKEAAPSAALDEKQAAIFVDAYELPE